jgi:hypothetical protein
VTGASPVARRRGTLIGVLVLLVAVTTTGCAAGFNDQSQKPFAPSIGAVGQIGAVKVLNSVVVTDPTGATAGQLLSVFVNTGSTPDELTGVEVEGGSPITIPGGSLTLDPLVANGFGDPYTNIASLTSLSRTPGQQVLVRYTFRNAGVLQLSTLVVDPANLAAGD